MKAKTLAMIALLLAGCPYAAHGTTVVLFADDFSNGSIDMPWSINDPDPQADPANNLISHNTSLSGSVFASFAPGVRPWHGDNAGPGTLGGEAGGIASWSNHGAGSGTIAPNVDFATDRAFQFGKNFTVSIEGLNPRVGGNGTSGDWAAINIFQTDVPRNGGGIEVNLPTTPFGILFRDSGTLSVFRLGSELDLPNNVFDSDPTTNPDKSYDIDLEVTNISGFGPGNSFDYRILVDGSLIHAGTINGVDTTANYIGFETRNFGSIMAGVTISTVVPEPATAGLMVIGAIVSGMALRRQIRPRSPWCE